ncbi:MAG: META domain-containing protein [Pseudotabrizicola sp.]|uniref:META domain-containing protein n=1 Tax=Pseudotabrizicola sp. TaxID=2939647 RepID=UPI0027194513|nr:META domain-containing protein [Pseudotabrizicola sp.]MDO9637875.1 META domain-containing protein [Pseudotabrizicola sp.]
MTRLTFACAATLALAAGLGGHFAGAQSVPAGDNAIQWNLVAIDGAPFDATATIDLATPGRITGQGPCNRFSASYDGALPDMRPGPVVATRMACADLAAESTMFGALSQMVRAEVTGPDTLLLTGAKGGSMEFQRAQP